MSSLSTANGGISSAGSRLVGKENLMDLCMPHAELLLLLLLLQRKLLRVRVASSHPLNVVKL